MVRDNKVSLDGTDAVNIFGGYAKDNSMVNVSFNRVEVTGGNVTGNITGGRASKGQAINNTVVISDTIKDIESVIGGFSNSSLADNNTVTLSNVSVAGDVYGGYSNTTSSGHFTSNNTVTLAGAEIGGNLIGGNKDGLDNNLIFASGPRKNLVKGSVNASGELLIVDGSNAITQSTNVGKLNITGGKTSVFNSKVDVNGDIAITGGDKNIFLADLASDSGDMVIAGGVNTFHDLMTNSANNITINGSSVNYYQGDVKTQKLSLNGGKHYFGATQSVDTSFDVVATNSRLELGAGAALTLTKSLNITQNSFLKLAGSASLKTTGLGLAGGLDLGVHDLDVEGKVTFASNSTIMFDYDGIDQGSLTATDQIKLTGKEPIKLALSNNNKIDPDLPIITATTIGALELSAENFQAPSYIKVIDTVPDKIYLYLRTSDETIEYLENQTIYTPTENDKNVVNAVNDQGTVDAFYSAVKLAEDSENMGILKRFMKQSSGETMLGVNIAIVDTVNQFQGVVYKRLDRIHEDNNAAGPPAAGSEDALNRIWVGGHGSWARQKNQAGHYGYDFHSAGFSLGYDRRAEGVPGLRFGLTTSFSVGQIGSNNGWTTIDSDTAGLGVYGSYQINNGLFFDANVAYAHSKNKAKNIGVNGGWKKGDFAINTWRIGARVGKIFDLGAVKLTPTVGLSYITARQDIWAESVHGTPVVYVNAFDKKSIRLVEIPFVLRLNGAFMAGSTKIIPEIRLGGTWAAKKPDNKLTVRQVNGDPDRWTVTGVKPASESFQAGVGVKVEINDFWDAFVNYELDAARGYLSHNAALGVGFNF
ncbi:MAG: autotransporter outer membrane beta-barrel domain-containing protein [Deltaproteobacteria bacterium]|nr:autotransporter outer membrane beta-barrel domain-containing protein [Deltaproteobacteria bacterium]